MPTQGSISPLGFLEPALSVCQRRKKLRPLWTLEVNASVEENLCLLKLLLAMLRIEPRTLVFLK